MLTVATDWFEQIGVDLDLYFNTNNTVRQQAQAVDPLNQLSDFFNDDGTLKDPLVFDSFTQTNFPPPGDDGTSIAPANQVAFGSQFGVPDATGQNITYVTGPTGAPIRAPTGLPPSASLRIRSALLKRSPVSPVSVKPSSLRPLPLSPGFNSSMTSRSIWLIQATQADRRSVVLTAPRLTFFNGQRAWIAVTVQQAFVPAFRPSPGIHPVPSSPSSAPWLMVSSSMSKPSSPPIVDMSP